MNLDTLIAFSALILSLLTVTLSLLVKITRRLAKIEFTLFPNGGNSLRDKVDKTERKLDILITQYEIEKEFRD